MKPIIEAEEALALISITACGAGRMNKQAREELIGELTRQAESRKFDNIGQASRLTKTQPDWRETLRQVVQLNMMFGGKDLRGKK